jgi:RNA polymerase sigma-70 factor (ECF subfamily)
MCSSPVSAAHPPGAALPCGDAARMGRLLAACEPRLAAVARRLVRDPEAARDVVQSAFEKALRRCHQFRGGARASTWLHRIVVNEALYWLRRERRREGLVEPESWRLPLAPDAGPAAAYLAADERAWVQRGFARLGRTDRALLEGAVIEGSSYEALGRELGLSPGAAKSRAFRARRRLEALLAAD